MCFLKVLFFIDVYCLLLKNVFFSWRGGRRGRAPPALKGCLILLVVVCFMYVYICICIYNYFIFFRF